MPLVSRLGAASSRGFGEFAQQTAANYIEDVFSTYLYTGNGSTQTITNGIDLAGKGGLVWIKARNQAYSNALINTISGAGKWLSSNLTNAEMSTSAGSLDSFLSSGFSTTAGSIVNENNTTYASWTFRKQPKFFDIVTYTGNGANRTIAHNLGSVPGMILIKRTDTTGAWAVYHTALANTEYLVLNTTAAKATGATYWNSTTPTSTVFSLGTATDVNASGGTYVAYLYAHDAGGFGADGSQNVISCGSFTTDGSGNATVNLGWEPQFVLFKATSISGNWFLLDSMRGLNTGPSAQVLYAQTSDAEFTNTTRYLNINATGFTSVLASNTSHIYMAIRRGPMATPTDATKVFDVATQGASSGATPSFVSDNVVDMALRRDKGTDSTDIASRITGTARLKTNTTDDETTLGARADYTWDYMVGWRNGTASTTTYSWMFRRAPGFFDVVCYTGTGSATTVSHNLGVVPELMIVKNRSAAVDWCVYQKDVGASKSLFLNTSAAPFTSSLYWNNTNPTNSVFTVNSSGGTNASGSTYVAYLFASCPGVSKVGTYTGTGATQTISCGFTGGARYVLIKRTDSTGDWWFWDTARGMVAGTDPRLAYNSTAAEANANWVYTTTGGFQIVTSDATVNANGGTYLFLAIS